LSAEHYVTNTEYLYANVEALNRYLFDTWGWGHDGTIYAPALLSLRDLDSALAEADRLLAQGVRLVLLPTGPAYGRSPGDCYFDPLYARLNEASVTIAFHIMPNWYFTAISDAWGHDTDPTAWRMSAWQWQNLYGRRAIEDTLSALIFDNLFGRFPNLNVIVAEHGAAWVPLFIEHMDKSRGMGRNGPWKGGKLTERPSQIFRSHVRVAPYPEDNIPKIVADLGGAECLVMGSDFPHAEGIAEPRDFAKLLDPLPADVVKAIMRTNAEEIFSA
jgi:predicted TIM-barrel fold metal-dependent hydrolase